MSLYTTSSLFLLSLSNAGITHLFVNWGSDHPGLLEDLQRQRVQNSCNKTHPEIVTCPNEMVALSAAQGYAQVTGKPAGVVVHVDVGTQALAGAVHNVDRSRTPVFIYAGASPVSSMGEAGRGTKNEWILWLQDAPDQPAILRPYMRHTVQIESPLVVPRVIRRALQIAQSAPKGPVYVWARREVMEAEVGEEVYANENSNPSTAAIHPVEPAGLSPKVLDTLLTLLLASSSPLILTSALGTSPPSVALLSHLSSLLALPIIQTCPNSVSASYTHPHMLGTTYLAPGTHHPRLKSSDLILILDCGLPWIPVHDRPKQDGVKIVWVDSGDVLGRTLGNRHVEPEPDVVVQADAGVVLEQLIEAIERAEPGLKDLSYNASSNSDLITKRNRRALEIKAEHDTMIEAFVKIESTFVPSWTYAYTVPNIVSTLRSTLASYPSSSSAGLRALYLNESITNYGQTWDHLRPTRAGEMLTSGGSSLGWALGAAVGAGIGGRVLGGAGGGDTGGEKPWDIIVAIVGDGSFLFGVPGSAYWIARKYNIPFLLLVLNNSGWKAPRSSMRSVHPTGHGAQPGTSGDTLSVGFGPVCPDYVGIARAATGGGAVGGLGDGDGFKDDGQGWCWGKRIGEVRSSGSEVEGVKEELERTMRDAVRAVVEEGRCAVLDCLIERV